MKKIIMLAAIVVVLLMVSSATAVPQISSKPVVSKLEKIEKAKSVLKTNLDFKQLKGIEALGLLGGIIQMIIDLIMFLINTIKGIFSGATAIKDAIENLKDILESMFDDFKVFLTEMIRDLIIGGIQALIGLIKDWINDLIDIITPSKQI